MNDKIFIKSLITGALILLMMIPAVIINNLVQEREERQKDAVQEAAHKWAAPQTFTGPYLAIPYTTSGNHPSHLILLPQDLSMSSKLQPEERSRSIYKIMLYRAHLSVSGKFALRLPSYLTLSDLNLANAQLCIGLSDYKGIEEKLSITAHGNTYDFQPGLPSKKINIMGLSTPFPLTEAGFNAPFDFSMTAHLKGSGQLQFTPLSANSTFHITSPWPSPSFDGNTLPVNRQVSDSGFTATWKFNQANLPFPVAITTEDVNTKEIAFGVSVVTPADRYTKTMRSIKYALLVIGLTFALFFVTELLQKQPVHPVQYVLVGLALILFYTLLLSVSEFIPFDAAYCLSATATIALITLYIKGHFKTWKIAGVFALTLSALYGFIFTIIRLEDTALLVGSIGLFVVLAIIMYASRKINWYKTDSGSGPLPASATPEPAINS